MKIRDTQGAVPLVRVVSLLRYVRHLQTLGAPVHRLLACSGIPEWLLEYPAAAVPLEAALRFGELACRTLGTEHLGLYVGLASSLDNLGPYGRVLQSAVTVHEYLHKGISLYNSVVSGQSLWLSEHGHELRLNIATVSGPRLGAYQAQMETLAVTIAKLRDAAGMDWSPREVILAYRSREKLPEIDLFAGSQVLTGGEQTYFTIPQALLRRRLAGGVSVGTTTDTTSPAVRALPQDLVGLVELEVENLLSHRSVGINTIAEILTMTKRSLQRSLARQGLTYSQVLAQTRRRLASDWLEHTDKPIGEIAFDLGYRDAANFTRAFGRQTGMSPQAYRDEARGTGRPPR